MFKKQQSKLINRKEDIEFILKLVTNYKVDFIELEGIKIQKTRHEVVNLDEVKKAVNKKSTHEQEIDELLYGENSAN